MQLIRLMRLAMLSVLGASLLAGCITQPGEEQVDEDNAAQPAQTAMRVPAAAEDPALTTDALDGRAAVAAQVQAQAQVLSGGTTAPVGLTSAWYSGALAPGATQHWYWNNASLTAAYQVGLSPMAAVYYDCEIEITRTWDVQRYGGEREFHFIIENTGVVSCGTDILLASQQRSFTSPTGLIAAGASRTWTWNNANPLTAAHFVGVSPTGATSTNPCQLEVTRTWYTQQPSGEREFKYTIANIGAIACQGDIQLTWTTNSINSWGALQIEPGLSIPQGWPGGPEAGVFVVGLSPEEASGTTPCQFEVTKLGYNEVNWTGTPDRQLFFTFKNVGSTTCSVRILINYLL